MTCSRCATINPDGATICASCGAPLMMGAAPPPASAYMPQPGQMPPGAMPYGYGMAPPMQQQRSSIPKVMGILMIVFASLGLLFTLPSLGGPKGAEELNGIAEWDKLVQFVKIFAFMDLGIGALHLFAGIRLVGYKKNGPMLAYIYAILRIVASIVSLAVVYAWLVPALDKLDTPGVQDAKTIIGGLFVFSAVISSIWPTLILILVSRRGSRDACVR
jgi:hypothetical protein